MPKCVILSNAAKTPSEYEPRVRRKTISDFELDSGKKE
jgi:hypothetical protein